MEISPPLKRTSAVEELIKGREFAARLGLVVQNSLSGDSSVAGELIEEVLSSFSRALRVLNSGGESTGANRNPATDLVFTDEAKSETCGEKRKSSGAGRGGSRKRKQSSQWRTVSSKTIRDEYSWRKYGQKEIHSSKFPRSYFRCTHKFDRGCTATKQVQKSEDDPSVFVITYMGQHSCRNPNTVTNSILSFGSNTSNATQEFSLPSSPLFSKRQECDEEVLSSLTPSTPSSENFDSPGLHKGPVPGPVATESASKQLGDESSGWHSSASSLDTRFLVDSLGCWDDLFYFDHGDFFRADLS